MVDRLLSRSAGTSTRRTAEGSSGKLVPSSATTVVTAAPHFRASASSFGPSQTNSPAARRAEREPLSLRMWATSSFFRLVIRSMVIPLRGHGAG